MSSSILVDRVKILVMSNGVGPFSLGPAVTGFRGIDALVDGATYSYAVENGAQYEVGQGTYLASGSQFVRTPEISSNGGAAVPFPANAQLVFTARAADLIATGGTFPIVNALGSDPNVAIAQQAATVALNGKAAQSDLTVLASNTAASFASQQTQINDRVQRVSTRSALAGINTTNVKAAFLAESGRDGIFVWRVGNFIGAVAADTYQGVYVAASSDPTGAAGCWVRSGVAGLPVRPEWFGVLPDDNTFDCRPILQKILDIGWSIQFSARKYYVGTGAAGVGTFAMQYKFNGQSIEGVLASKDSGFSGHPGAGTEIIIRSASMSGFLMGFTSDPGGPAPDTWREGCQLRNLTCRRDVASFPLGNPASGYTNLPVGALVKYAVTCTVQNFYAMEHSAALWRLATVACRFINVRGERFTSGVNLANDVAIGILQDNTLSTPYNSGNASVFDQYNGFFSNMAAGNVYPYAAALKTIGGFTDTYIVGMEGANSGYGLDFEGRTSSGGDWHTEDLIVTQCVMDGCRWDGLRFSLCGPNSAVRVSDNYFGVTMATSPVSRGMNFQTVNGSFSVSGNQTIGVVGNPATGVYVFNSSGVMLTDNIYTNMQDPIYADGAVGCRFKDRVSAGLQGPLTAAAQFLNTSASEIAIAAGAPGSGTTLPKGITMNSACARNGVDLTGINSANVTGGAANKLWYNGASQGVGSFGTNNLASGVGA